MIRVKRLAALVIDHIIACIGSTAIVMIVSCGTAETTVFNLSVYFIFYIGYMIMKECIFKNAGIGKKIMHICVVAENGKPLSASYFLKKAVVSFLIFPVEIMLILIQGVGIVDIWTKTKVIDCT